MDFQKNRTAVDTWTWTLRRESLLSKGRLSSKYAYQHSNKLPIWQRCPTVRFWLAHTSVSSVMSLAGYSLLSDLIHLFHCKLFVSVWKVTSVRREIQWVRPSVCCFFCVYLTVDGLQLVVPEDECEEFGPAAQAQRWRPLQAVVAQVQMLQFSQRLSKWDERGKDREKTGWAEVP